MQTHETDNQSHPSAIWKWLVVLLVSLIASAYHEYYEYGQLSASLVGLARIVGRTLPTFLIAMLFAHFCRGYAGIVLGVVMVVIWSFFVLKGIQISR